MSRGQRRKKTESGRFSGRIDVHKSSDGKVQIESWLEGHLFQEDGAWISFCPALDLTTCADTRQQVLVHTKEAIELFFKSCVQRGTLKAALKNLNWEIQDNKALMDLLDDYERRASLEELHPSVSADPRMGKNRRSWKTNATIAA